jgi:hypothetical protein
MSIDFHTLSIMDWVRWGLSVIFVGAITYVFWVLVEANVRNYVEERGWNKVLSRMLTRALEKMPDPRPYRRFWFGVGLIFGAVLITWLAWAFPSVMGTAEFDRAESNLVAMTKSRDALQRQNDALQQRS